MFRDTQIPLVFTAFSPLPLEANLATSFINHRRMNEFRSIRRFQYLFISFIFPLKTRV